MEIEESRSRRVLEEESPPKGKETQPFPKLSQSSLFFSFLPVATAAKGSLTQSIAAPGEQQIVRKPGPASLLSRFEGKSGGNWILPLLFSVEVPIVGREMKSVGVMTFESP